MGQKCVINNPPRNIISGYINGGSIYTRKGGVKVHMVHRNDQNALRQSFNLMSFTCSEIFNRLNLPINI